MTRVKKGAAAHKHKKHLLTHAKGFKYGRKSKYKLAKDALRHAWTFSYRDRKVKKRDFRQLWQLQINAAARALGINYSRLINGLKKKKSPSGDFLFYSSFYTTIAVPPVCINKTTRRAKRVVSKNNILLFTIIFNLLILII